MIKRTRSKRQPITATHVARLAADQAGDELVSVSVGPNGEAVALWAPPADVAALHGREIAPGGASFAMDRLDVPVTVRVTTYTPELLVSVAIPDFRLAFPVVQPMPGDQFLVVSSRVRRLPEGTPPNAFVYDSQGQPVAEGLLGDGIEHVQTTPSGQVWVGYFDEGVYGNFGWGNGPGTEPVGAAGLVRFASELTVDWRYSGDEPIDDCYALNVDGEAAWACYYSGFPLVEVHGDAVRAWDNSVGGARAIAVHDDRVAFYGGYGDDADRLVVGRIGGDAVEVERECRVVLPGGGSPAGAQVFGRGSTLHLFVGREWYRLDLADLVR